MFKNFKLSEAHIPVWLLIIVAVLFMIFGIFIGSEINKDKHIVQANESISFEEQTTEEPLESEQWTKRSRI